MAQLPAQTVQFPLGCEGQDLGVPSQYQVYAGTANNGNQVFVGQNVQIYYAGQYYTVVLANPTSGAVSISTLPQQSTVEANVQYNVADLNGDGIPDVVGVVPYNLNSGNGGVYVWLGNGDGTFANPVEYAAGPYPYSVTIADVNGDGKLDLIVYDNNPFAPNNIQVLLGNGDGTFQPAINAGTSDDTGGTEPYLATGDFNGDGKLDLVASDGNILLGNGDGTFQPPSFTLPINLDSTSGGYPVVGDFNHDGKLDIAMNMTDTTNQTGTGQVTIFSGNGDGTFTTGASYVNIVGSQHMAAEDVDGDGNLDLIVGSGDNGVYGEGSTTRGVTQFLMGRGDGTFAGAPTYQNVAYGGVNPIAPVFTVGDFNGDGKPDILTDVMSNGIQIQGMTLMTGDGKGNFTQGPTIDDYPLILTSADMNGDSHLDAVYAGELYGNYGVYIALGNGDGTFQPATFYALPDSGKINDLVVGDFNGDGKPDVMVTASSFTSGTGAIYLFLGNGDGTLQPGVLVDSPPQAYGLAAGDFNHDGNLDFVVTNPGTMSSSTAGSVRGFVSCDSRSASASTASSGTSGSVLVYLGKGGGAFNPPVSYTASMFPGPVAVADMNMDGNLDLVVASQDNAAVTSTNPLGPHATLNVLLGNGDGTFQTALSSPLNDTSYTNLAIADMNQDGIPDVIVGDNGSGTNNYTQILYGKGDGTFPTGNSLQMGRASTSVTAVDVNGDNRPDLMLVSGGPTYANLDIFLNQYSAPATETLPASLTSLSVSPNPAVVGQTITFTAQVAASSGSTEPTGTVSFMNGSTQLGSGTLDSSGQATYATSSFATGSYSVTAVYSGDTNFAGSTSSPVSLTVNSVVTPVATTTTLTASPATVTAGESVALTAVVKPNSGAGVPTGTVTFLDGATTLGTGTLDGTGTATYSTNSLAVGSHTITASYGGDANNAASTSAAVTVTIQQAAAGSFTASLSPASGAVTAGQSATTTLTLTPSGTISQPVSFSCSGLPTGATCGFSPTTVTLGSTPATTKVTIATSNMASAVSPGKLPGSAPPLFALGFGAGLFGLFWRRRGKDGKRNSALFASCLIALALGVTAAIAGCGGSQKKNNTTQSTTSTVMITATAGSITQTATYALTVQ